MGNKQGVGAYPFNPRSSQTVTAQIQKPLLPFKFLVFPIDKHNAKQRQIPEALIKEGRVHLDVVGSLRHMGRDSLGNIRCSDHLGRKTHRKQIIRVLSKNFPVGEIPPAADYLTEYKPRHADIRNLQKTLFFPPAVDPKGKKSGNHRTVNGQSAVSQIKHIKQIILIGVPAKYHVINPGPDNGKDNGVNRKIPDQVSVQPLQLRHMGRQQDAAQHAYGYNHAVKRNRKAKN